MKIISVFEQPARDNHKYVVTQGCVNDIACYFGDKDRSVEWIVSYGRKLTERSFRKTLCTWDYEGDGLHYRL